MMFGTDPVVFTYHLGAHFTDSGILLGSLAKDRDRLAELGVAIPKPRKFNRFLTDSLETYKGATIPEEEQIALYDLLSTDWRTKRVVISSSELLCPMRQLFAHDVFYGKAAYRSTWIRALFPDNPCEFHFAVCNPLRFLAAYYDVAMDQPFDQSVLADVDLSSFWTDAIGRIRYRNPDVPIYVWVDENSHAQWDEILNNICDAPVDFGFTGAEDLAAIYLDGADDATPEDAPAVTLQQRKSLTDAGALLDQFDARLQQHAKDAFRADLTQLSARGDIVLLD